MAHQLNDQGFVCGALHALQVARTKATTSESKMNTTAAFIIQLLQVNLTISTNTLTEFTESCEICETTNTTSGAWALCVVASKCYLASNYPLAYILFSKGLLLDQNSNNQSVASKIAYTYSGDCLCSTAGKELVSNTTQEERWNQAESFYNNALAMDSKFVDAKSSLAELLRKRGSLERSLLEFQSIYECLDATKTGSDALDLIFNHSQCLESMCRYEEAFSILVQQAETAITRLPPTGDVARVAEHALVLLYLKIRYVANKMNNKTNKLQITLTPWKKLIFMTENWSISVQQIIRIKLPTHWAYAYFLRQLWCTTGHNLKNLQFKQERHIDSDSAWLPIVGDSHCLSLAWSTISNRQVVPFVATGLKAWHVRKECSPFVTVSNLTCIFNILKSKNVTDILFSCGEIDCREGIAAAVKKGKHATIQDAVRVTVGLMLEGLQFQTVGSFTVHMLTCPPPVNKNENMKRAKIVQFWNKELRRQCVTNTIRNIRLIDVESECLCSSGLFLKDELNADGTHLNHNLVKVLEKSSYNF